MTHRPTSRHGDQTLALLTDPYRRLSHLFEQAGADVVETRLALKETTCLRGREAARIFYDETRIVRAGAMPATHSASVPFGSMKGFAFTAPSAVGVNRMSPSSGS